MSPEEAVAEINEFIQKLAEKHAIWEAWTPPYVEFASPPMSSAERELIQPGFFAEKIKRQASINGGFVSLINGSLKMITKLLTELREAVKLVEKLDIEAQAKTLPQRVRETFEEENARIENGRSVLVPYLKKSKGRDPALTAYATKFVDIQDLVKELESMLTRYEAIIAELSSR